MKQKDRDFRAECDKLSLENEKLTYEAKGFRNDAERLLEANRQLKVELDTLRQTLFEEVQGRDHIARCQELEEENFTLLQRIARYEDKLEFLRNENAELQAQTPAKSKGFCARCHQAIEINHTGRKRSYCSDACKQADYRDRKELERLTAILEKESLKRLTADSQNTLVLRNIS